MAETDSRQGKEALRSRYRRLRDETDRDSCARSSVALSRNLSRVQALDAMDIIAGYVSFRNEIDIGPYLETRLEANRAVCLPRVQGDHLEFVQVHDLHSLVPGAFGILEPVGEPFPVAEIEVFLVPGLVFDHDGARLGFGKGYYDRVLCSRSGHRPLAIGVCYAWQLIDSPIPVEPHDVSMDLIATDEGIFSSSDRVKI
ncbi:MAG: 5-formyltetrahydrofolate cyclo-ligase [Bradymonadaceae bacterium]